jgi:small-conductance mechanosensitive channel
MQRMGESLRWSWLARLGDLARGTQVWFLLVLALYGGSLVLDVPERMRQVLDAAMIVALLVQAAIWGNALLTFVIAGYIKRREADAATATTISAFGFLARLALWTTVALLVLDNLGVNVTALIAGLGIGSIAVALATQNILGDLFASLIIVLDKPFVLGDFVVVGEHRGTIEQIGLKTTRVRSLTGEQLVFPNSDLLQSRIRNFKRMQERRVEFVIGVTYDTPRAKLVEIPGMLRAAVEAQELTRFDRAHFKEFGNWSLNFEVVYFVLSPDYVPHMDVLQAINLRIVEQFEAADIEFAFPTQTVHLSGPGSGVASAPR